MIIFCYAGTRNLEQTLRGNLSNYLDYTWGLLGEDYESFEKLHLLFGNDNRDEEIGPLFQDISRKLRAPMLEFMGKLSKDNHSLEWWCTGLASKSIFQQDLFLRVCYVKLIYEIDKKGKDIILFVQDVEFFLFLKGLFAQRFIFITDKILSFQNIKCCFRQFIRKYWCIARLVVQKLLLIGTHQQPLDMETLISSLIVAKSFDGGLQYRDLWGGKFYDEFSKFSTCKRFTYSLIEPKQLKKAFLSHVNFVYTFAYCSWAEFLFLSFKKVRLNRNGQYLFQGIDLEPLIDMEIRKNNGGLIIHYLVFYKGLSRIIKNTSRLRIIFHPFEGQPWEKMIKLAVENSKRDIKTFGFQHSGFSELQLSNFCSEEEYNLNTMPDYILANSDYNRSKLGRDGFPSDKILTIGDLRFGYLAKNKASVEKVEFDNLNTVLLCLTIKIDQSLMALRDCCMVFSELRNKGYKFRVFVKPHPLRPFSMEKLAFMEGLEGQVEYYDGDLKAVLDKSNILIYLNGAVGCEALQLGKTVIQKMTDLAIDLDPLNPREKQPLLYPCFFNELENTLENLFIDNREGKIKEASGMNVPSFFDPIQYHTIEKINLLAHRTGIGR